MAFRPTSSSGHAASSGPVSRGTTRGRGPVGVLSEGAGERPNGFPELARIRLTPKEASELEAGSAIWKGIVRQRKKYYKPRWEEWNAATVLAAVGEAAKPGGNPRKPDPEAINEYYGQLLAAGDRRDVLQGVYDRMCMDEYARVDAALKPAFETMNRELKLRGPVWRYYQYLRSAYVVAGFKNPLRTINRIDSKATFLGKRVWCGAHPALAKLLDEVETILRREGAYDEVAAAITSKHFGGFVPRYIANSRSLSNHSLGLAIDIDAGSNPHLVGKSATIVDQILDYMHQEKGTRRVGSVKQALQTESHSMSMAEADRLREMSGTLQAFLAEWIPRVERGEAMTSSGGTDDADRPLLLAVDFIAAIGGVARAKSLKRTGIITLPTSLFRAMREAGARSGIDYKSSKDTMHFELLPEALKI